MNIGSPLNHTPHRIAPQRASQRFSGWEPGINGQPIRSMIDTIETTLATPVSKPSVPTLEQYAEEHRPKIAELQDILKKVEANNGYGFDSAIAVLRTMTTSGYQLTKPETEKLKMLVQKSTYGLESAIAHFPRKNEYDRSTGSFTMNDFMLFLPQWLKEQNTYAPIEKLVQSIERSTKFTAPIQIQAAITNRLSEINQNIQNDDARETLLKTMGTSFRPKAVIAQELKKVMDTLFPAEGLFSAQTAANNQQVIDLAAQRNTKIEFAGRTAQGDVYIVSENQTNYQQKLYYGQPGEVKAYNLVTGSRAKDGSDTYLKFENNLEFRFLRGGMFSGNDLSAWSATLNEEAIPQEYPTFKLDK